VELFFTVVVASVTVGLLYALFAMGLGLVLRTSGDLNLAHGDSLMLATYAGVGTAALTGARALGLTAVVVVGALLGAVAYLTIFGPVARRKRSSAAGLGFLPALGVALVIRNVAVQFNPEGSRPLRPLFPGGRANLFADYRLPAAGWWVLGVALVVPGALAFLLRHSVTGRRLRAVADEPVLARAAGLPVTRSLAISYAVAGAVGGLAGALFASFFGLVFVALGWQATLKGFVVALLGGVDWIRGAVVGGLALGALESFVAAYVSTQFRDVVSFLLLIAVLLIAPRGVLGREQLRTV